MRKILMVVAALAATPALAQQQGGGGSGGGGGGSGTVTSITAGNGVACSPNPVTTTATCSASKTDSTKTSSYTAATGDMGGALNLAGTSGTPALTLPAKSSTLFAPGMTLNVAVTGTVNWTLTNSTGLTLTGLNSTTLPPGTSGTFVANANGTGLDFFAGAQPPATGALGGVESVGAVSHNFLTGISTAGVPSQAQPAFTDISGTAQVAQGGTGVTSAQGNGTKVQLSTGSTTTNDCVKFDANGNTIDAGAACGSGGGSGVNQALFGNGSDGNLNSGFGTVTVTRDAQYNNVTIGATDHIITQGNRLFVAGTWDVSSAGASAIEYRTTATRTGTAASGATGGTFVTPLRSVFAPVCYQGGSGGASSATTGSAGGGADNPTNNAGEYSATGFPAGSTGGAGTNAAGSAAGINSTGFAVTLVVPQTALPTVYTATTGPAESLLVTDGGSGGSGGGGDGTHVGGGGGGGGDCGGGIYIYANTIARGTNTTASIIDAVGGTGGTGGNGNAGCTGGCGGGAGGNGGNGGYIYIVAGSLTGSTITNALDVSSGAGGAGGTATGTGANGSGGNSGYSGAISVINLGAGTAATTAAGSTSNTHSGATGGASVAAQQNL
ncbi:MAG TPA: hypothetical protein VLV50_13495 [Stellaceae bacterium]|nr:hypothetical protein [Stellaceae bacterium]